jgi:hypothetical protein
VCIGEVGAGVRALRAAVVRDNFIVRSLTRHMQVYVALHSAYDSAGAAVQRNTRVVRASARWVGRWPWDRGVEWQCGGRVHSPTDTRGWRMITGGIHVTSERDDRVLSPLQE